MKEKLIKIITTFSPEDAATQIELMIEYECLRAKLDGAIEQIKIDCEQIKYFKV